MPAVRVKCPAIAQAHVRSSLCCTLCAAAYLETQCRATAMLLWDVRSIVATRVAADRHCHDARGAQGFNARKA